MKRVLIAVGFAAALVAGLVIRPSGIYDSPAPTGPPPSVQHQAADSSATTAYPSATGWSSPAQMAPVGTLCFQTGGGTVLGPSIVAAAAGWNKTNLTVVAQKFCTGYPRDRTLLFKAYYNSKTTPSGYVTECATYSGGGYAWKLVRNVWTWVATQPTVNVNYSALAVKQCMFSTAAKTNMMSHESGHYLGLAHRTGATVMTSGMNTTYITATYYDIKLANTRYVLTW